LVFESPDFGFQHKSPVNVKISASDNSNNLMTPFSYIFIPHIYATPSVKKRNYLNTVALDYISDIQSNIASNYTRSKSSNFYSHHKAISLELARHTEEIDHLNEDRNYNTLRDIHLYDKFGYLLLTESNEDLSHSDYRRMLQSLVSILFKGSLKSSIEAGIQIFTGMRTVITEPVFSLGADISQQFIFYVDLFVGETRTLNLDLFVLQANLAHMFDLVKPAHVFLLQRFVWEEVFRFQSCHLVWELNPDGSYKLDDYGNRIPVMGPDGFQKTQTDFETAICDRSKIIFNNLYLEDVTEDCLGIRQQIDFNPIDVNIANDTIVMHSYCFYDEQKIQKVIFYTSDVLPEPLITNNEYWIYKEDELFKVALTREDALAKIAIDITTQGIGIHTVSQIKHPHAHVCETSFSQVITMLEIEDHYQIKDDSFELTIKLEEIVEPPQDSDLRVELDYLEDVREDCIGIGQTSPAYLHAHICETLLEITEQMVDSYTRPIILNEVVLPLGTLNNLDRIISPAGVCIWDSYTVSMADFSWI